MDDDSQLRVVSHDFTLHEYSLVRAKGDDIVHKNGSEIQADYALAEAGVNDSGAWASGATHEITVEVTPEEPGQFAVFMRGTISDDANQSRKFSTSGLTTDQQGFDVDLAFVDVETTPSVSTADATSVGIDGATLHGDLSDSGHSDAVDIYFRYREQGTNQWQGTANLTRSSTGNFDISIGSLRSGTTYEYQAVAKTAGGTDGGTIRTFTTDNQDPDPTFDTRSIPSSVELGESFQVRVVVSNNGGPGGNWSTITLSFPSLSDSDDDSQIRIVSHDFTLHEYSLVRSKDDGIIHNNDSEIPAEYALAEAGVNVSGSWASGAAHELTVEVTPEEAGKFPVYMRGTITDDDEWLKFTTSGSVTDQQGFVSNPVTVDVVEPLNVTTGGATSVTDESAVLEGRLKSLGDASSAEVYFRYREHGTNQWEGSSNLTRSSRGDFDVSITGLNSGTTYEYQVVAKTAGETDTGRIRPFTTDNQDPDPTFDTRSIPSSVELGESFQVRVVVTNNGGPGGNWSTITLSFPSLTEPEDGSQVDVVSHDFSTHKYSLVQAKDDTIIHKNDSEISAKYALAEAGVNVSGSWASGASHEITVEVTPEEAGEFPVYLRGTITDDRDWRKLTTAGNVTDQQGFVSDTVTVDVVEPSSESPILARDEVYVGETIAMGFLDGHYGESYEWSVVGGPNTSDDQLLHTSTAEIESNPNANPPHNGRVTSFRPSNVTDGNPYEIEVTVDGVETYNLTITVKEREIINGKSHLELAQEYAPVLHFHPDENFYPTRYEAYVENSELRDNYELTNQSAVELRNASLLDLGAEYAGNDNLLLRPHDYAGGPYIQYQNDSVYPRTVYTSVHKNVEIEGSTQTYTAIGYWMFYVNDPKPVDEQGIHSLFGAHTGDQEPVFILFDDNGDPQWIAAQQHRGGELRAWSKIETEGYRPVLYIAEGAHSIFFGPYSGTGEKSLIDDQPEYLYQSQYLCKNGNPLPCKGNGTTNRPPAGESYSDPISVNNKDNTTWKHQGTLESSANGVCESGLCDYELAVLSGNESWSDYQGDIYQYPQPIRTDGRVPTQQARWGSVSEWIDHRTHHEIDQINARIEPPHFGKFPGYSAAEERAGTPGFVVTIKNDGYQPDKFVLTGTAEKGGQVEQIEYEAYLNTGSVITNERGGVTYVPNSREVFVPFPKSGEWKFSLKLSAYVNSISDTPRDILDEEEFSVTLDDVPFSIEFIETPSGNLQPGETANATVRIENNGSEERTMFVGFSASDPEGQFHDNTGSTGRAVTIDAGDNTTVELSWTVEEDLPAGSYDLVTAVWNESDPDNLTTQLDNDRDNGAFTVQPQPVIETMEVESINDSVIILNVTAVNEGAMADWQTLAVSLPALGGQEIDSDAIEGDFNLYLDVFGPGETVGSEYGTNQSELNYPLVEGGASDWGTGERRHLVIELPSDYEGNTAYIKSISSARNNRMYIFDPGVNQTEHVDQQGEFVYEVRVGTDTTQPLITDFDVTNPSGSTLAVSFNSNESLANISVTITNDSATVIEELSETQFTESGSYTYTWSDTVPNGTYKGTLISAEDSSGNDGASGQTDSTTISVDTSDTSAPSITNFSVQNPAGSDIRVVFDSNESLSSIRLNVAGPTSEILTESNFTESDLTYVTTYTATRNGSYTATLEEAHDTAGNDGASGESGTVNIELGSSSKSTSNITIDRFESGDYDDGDPITWQTESPGEFIKVQNSTVNNGTYSLAMKSGSNDDNHAVLNHQAMNRTIGDGDVYSAWIRSDGRAFYTITSQAGGTKSQGPHSVTAAVVSDHGKLNIITRDASGNQLAKQTLGTADAGKWYFFELEFHPSRSEVTGRVYDSSMSLIGEQTMAYSGTTGLEYTRLSVPTPFGRQDRGWFDDVVVFDGNRTNETESNTSGAMQTAVSLEPHNQSVDIGGSTTYDIVIDSVDGGVGAHTTTVSLSNSTVANITNVTLYGNPGLESANYAADNSSVMIDAALMDTNDTGSVTIATVTVDGEATGNTSALLRISAIGNETGVNYNVTETQNASLVVGPIPVIGDFENPPTDRDGDGLYEDVNGNGDANIVDVQAMFANRDDPNLVDHPEFFDFSGNGDIDIVDVQALFVELST